MGSGDGWHFLFLRPCVIQLACLRVVAIMSGRNVTCKIEPINAGKTARSPFVLGQNGLSKF